MRGFLVLISGLFAILFGAIAALATGHKELAYLTSFAGTTFWLLLMLAYIVFWDSRKRWPGKECLRSPREGDVL